MVAIPLQALGLIPPSLPGSSVSRRVMPPSREDFLGFTAKILVPIAPTSLYGESRRVLRPVMATGGSDKVDDSGKSYSQGSQPIKVFTWGKPLVDFASNNFLPLALVGGISLGLANPSLGCVAHKYSLSKFSSFGIFFISGLMLRTSDLGAAIEAWPAGLFGLGSILLFTPFLSKLILQIRLIPPEFVTGLAIFCCMPTTLSSGVTLTQLAGGNSALALAMTVISNLLGIMIIPLSLSKFIGAGAGVSMPTTQLFSSLINTLLIPLVLGKIVREASKGIAEFSDQNRQTFSMISAILLSLVPWMQVSRSRSLLLTVKPEVFAVAITLGILLHLSLLVLNATVVQSLSLVSGGNQSVFGQKENSRALVLVASQKTLPVMVAVVEQLGGALGDSGLLVLPGVASHINQIIIDSFIVNWWCRKDQQSDKTKKV